jgi:hypothetical protein
MSSPPNSPVSFNQLDVRGGHFSSVSGNQMNLFGNQLPVRQKGMERHYPYRFALTLCGNVL